MRRREGGCIHVEREGERVRDDALWVRLALVCVRALVPAIVLLAVWVRGLLLARVVVALWMPLVMIAGVAAYPCGSRGLSSCLHEVVICRVGDPRPKR